MKYLKIFTTFKKNIQRLSDEECGRLFRAMLEYAETGEDVELEGREDVVWPIAQEQIDNCREAYESKAGAARKLNADRSDNDAIAQASHDNDTISHDNDTISERYRDDTEDKEQRIKNKEQRITDKGEKDTRAREGALDRRFSTFWSAYPNKTGKGAALKAFQRVKPDDALLDTMLSQLELMRASPQWQSDGGRYIPNPATWLNQRRWEDEVRGSPPAQNETARLMALSRQYAEMGV